MFEKKFKNIGQVSQIFDIYWLVDVCGLDYTRSEHDDSKIVVWLTLNKDEFFDIFERVQLLKPDAQYFAEALLNAEITEYTTRITVDKPTGETITFE